MTIFDRNTFSLRCPRCGSRDCQTREIAFAHSHRRNAGGYESVSSFGQSISPPPKRSVFWAPLGIGIGIGCTTLFLAAAILGQDATLPSVLAGTSDSRAVWTGIATGFLAFVAIALRAALWNETAWRRLHGAWRGGAVCRRCGHQFKLPGTSQSQKGGSSRG